MVDSEVPPALLSSEFIQPHPKACTPTNMAYLISITKNHGFKHVLNTLLQDKFISSRLNAENRGISFPEIVDVVKKKSAFSDVSISLVDWIKQPTIAPPFIIGVKQLPSVKNLDETQSMSISLAERVGSLKKVGGMWEYPNGHALTVTKIDEGEVQYFDSCLGKLISITPAAFKSGLRDKGELIKIQ